MAITAVEHGPHLAAEYVARLRLVTADVAHRRIVRHGEVPLESGRAITAP
jgi:hypothetical protein